jgi:hypothetical protein
MCIKEEAFKMNKGLLVAIGVLAAGITGYYAKEYLDEERRRREEKEELDRVMKNFEEIIETCFGKGGV